MVDKRIPLAYNLLFALFSSVMIVLMTLLFFEYRFFSQQAQQFSYFKHQYKQSVVLLCKKINGESLENNDDVYQDMSEDVAQLYDIAEDQIEESSMVMDDIVAAENSDAPDNDDEYVDDSFIVINRQPDYLKQSTIDYMESQEMNALMTAIDIDRWSDYTDSYDSLVHKPSEKRNTTVKNKTIIKNKTVAVKPKPVTKIQQHKEQKNSATRRPVKECGFIWPIALDKFWLSSLFGPRKRIDGTWGFHHGIDMAAVKGTAVKAVRGGTIIEASFQPGYGNTVLIKHTNALTTRYAHLHTIHVHVGQDVKSGFVIGTVGETGFVRKKGKDGSHLHFEVYENGKRINPMHCLPRMT